MGNLGVKNNKVCISNEQIRAPGEHTSHALSPKIQCVLLATEPGISIIILTPMKILQRNLNRSRFIVWEMKRNVSVVRFKFRCNILISGKIIKEMAGSLASGTHCITLPCPQLFTNGTYSEPNKTISQLRILFRL